MLRYLVALALLGHGIGHSIFLMASWGMWQGTSGQSWLLTWNPLVRAFGVLWLVPLAGFGLGAWAVATQQSWWSPLLIASAALSAALVVIQWNGLPVQTAFFALAFDVVALAYVLWQHPAAGLGA